VIITRALNKRQLNPLEIKSQCFIVNRA